MVSQNVETALEHFDQLNGDSVVKPLFGSGGRRIVRLCDREHATLHFKNAVDSQEVIYQQEYIEHGDSDLRLLTIGDDVVGMRRHLAGEWVTNAQRGADCSAHVPNDNEKQLALNSAGAVGALVSGVDLVYRSDGEPFVVEINSCPSWKVTSQATRTDVSAKILVLIESELARRSGNGVLPNRTTEFHFR